MYKKSGELISVKEGDLLLLEQNPEKFWEGVKDIGYAAFLELNGLKNITIPEGVTYINRGAFLGCKNLTSVKIQGSVEAIEEYAFADCTSLTEVTILKGVEFIGYQAFYGCNNLESINIPTSIECIKKNAIPNNERIKIRFAKESLESYIKNLNEITSILKQEDTRECYVKLSKSDLKKLLGLSMKLGLGLAQSQVCTIWEDHDDRAKVEKMFVEDAIDKIEDCLE